MEGQITDLELVESAEYETAADKDIDAYCWRMEQLLDAGYTPILADALASDRAVDLHVACDLLACGCPLGTAYLIMA